MVLFLACWLPFHVSNLLLRVHWMTLQDIPAWAIGLIHILVVIYPSLSPCIFAFRCKRLQRELRRMMRRRNSGGIHSDLPPRSCRRAKNTQHLRASIRKFSLRRKTVQKSMNLKRVEEEGKCSQVPCLSTVQDSALAI